MLGTVVALAAVTAPPALAFDNRPPSAGGPSDVRPAAVQHQSASTGDWIVVGIGAAGGIALVGVGAAGIRRSARRPTGTVGAAGGS